MVEERLGDEPAEGKIKRLLAADAKGRSVRESKFAEAR